LTASLRGKHWDIDGLTRSEAVNKIDARQ